MNHQHTDERPDRMDLLPLKTALADVVAIRVTPFARTGPSTWPPTAHCCDGSSTDVYGVRRPDRRPLTP
ncbi:hypothetical protein ACFU8Q_20610 [Streptomyces sp. NPDC057543]|uniref:hypothetical protein n=1 Tax=Streptomyces sp. NPDC057543 TaxID=3346163 RepID=UPI00368FEFB4